MFKIRSEIVESESDPSFEKEFRSDPKNSLIK
jgi:hypothetical protein